MLAVVVGASRDRLFERLQMRVHVLDGGLIAHRRLHPLGDLVRLLDRDVGGHLQMQRDTHPAVMLVDGDVVRLPDQWFREGGSQHAVPEVQAAATRLEMDHHVGLRQRVADGSLNGVGRTVTLNHCLPRRHTNNGVGKVTTTRLTYSQPTQLDRLTQSADRCLSAGSSLGPSLSSMLIYLLMAVVLYVRPTGLFPAKGR